MKVESVKLDSLTLDPANVRTHGERNIDAIKASLKKFGQQKPIVVDGEGNVIAGNGTLEAARHLGWTRINVVRSDLHGVEAVGYAIADNRTAELAAWDEPNLAEVLATLQTDEEFEAAITGFDDDEIERLTGVFDAEISSMPELPDGDRTPLQQMTFTLHDDQAELVLRAIASAKKAGPFIDTGNENSNGNALARIAEAYCGKG